MTERNSESMGDSNQQRDELPVAGGAGSPISPAGVGKPSSPKRRRRWPWVIGAIVIVLVLIAVLLPSLVSTSVGRSLVLSQVNSRINGRLDIRDWSIGWFSGISADGVVINDESNRQILQLPHFGTKLGLLGAIRGKFNIGQTQVDGLDVLVSREADGTLNWEHLAKGAGKKAESAEKRDEPAEKNAEPAKPQAGQTAPAAAPEVAKGEPVAGGIKLPGVSGELIISNARITYEDAGHRSEPVYLRNIEASVKIPDINQPITDSFSAETQIGSQKPGTISADGTIAAVANNVLMTSPAQLDQTLKLNGLDVGAVMSLVGKSVAADLSGRAQGQVVIHLSDGNGTADSSLEIANVNLSHGRGAGAKQVLSNDTFSFVANAKYAQSASGREVRVNQLKLGDSAGTFLIQKSAEGDVVAILPQAGNPSAQGAIDISANLKTMNEIAQAFSTAVTARDPNGMAFQSGMLKGRISLAQAGGDQIAISGELGITQITVGNATATPLKDQTITMTLKAQANHDLSKVTPELHVSGDLFTADVTNVELALAGAPNGSAPSQPLKRATIEAKLPSLAKVQMLLRSFSPPKPANAASNVAMIHGPAIASAGALSKGAVPDSTTQPAEAPSMDVTGGSLSLSMTAETVGKNLHVVPKIVVSDLALKKGDQSYAMSSINVASDATVVSGESVAVQDLQLTKADVDLNDLAINGKPYEEKRLHLGAVAALGSGMKVLDLQNITAQAATTDAFAATIKGKITDLGASQKIDNALKMDLSYDAGQVLKLAIPLLSADLQKRLKDAVASGKFQEPFEVKGSYPSGKAFNEAVQQLAVTGRLQVDSFEGAGVAMTKLDLPITMNGGFARIIYADKPTGENLPPAAGFNGGTLTLAGTQVDLRGATPTLTTVGNLRLIDKAGLNPVFAAWSLGTILANPLFFDAEKATGYLTITLVDCRGLPLDSSLTTGQNGAATLDLSIAQLTVVNGLIEKLSSVAHFDANSIRGDIPKWRIVVDRGIADQDLTMTIGQNQRPLHMFGKVRLADQEMLPLTVDLPWKLFGIKGVPRGLESTLPEGIQIPMSGPISKPQLAFDFNKMLADSAGNNLGKALPGILGGGDKGAKGDGTTQPAENDPLKSLGDLLDQATKKKKKK